ncbi:MAG: hypothetical protein WD851_20885 [Pirellulales bacterium]
MAAVSRSPQELLAQLDARHDELLTRLEDLNERILAALAELMPTERGKPIIGSAAANASAQG